MSHGAPKCCIVAHTGSMQITLFRGCPRMIPGWFLDEFLPNVRQVETSLQSYHLAKPDLQLLVLAPLTTIETSLLDNLSYRLWTLDINIVQGAAKCYTFTMLVVVTGNGN